MKTLRKIMLVCMCLLLPASGAWAVALSLDAPTSAAIGQTFTVNVKVDTTAGLAGAAFTVAYDTSVIELVSPDEVTSTFFGTFVNQFAGMPCAPNCPTQSSDGYTQPLISNTVTDAQKLPGTGTRVAAARVQPEAAATSNTTLFTLKMKFIKDAAAENTSYDISIMPTYLDNASAGYETGQYIPLLIGYDDTVGATDEFPKLLESASGTAVATASVQADAPPDWSLDIDGNGSVQPTKDVFLLYRYSFGQTGTDLVKGIIFDASATRKTPEAIEAYLAEGKSSLFLDIDGNGSVQPTKDIFLVYRYKFGQTGTDLVKGIIFDASATRKTPEAIQAYIDSLTP